MPHVSYLHMPFQAGTKTHVGSEIDRGLGVDRRSALRVRLMLDDRMEKPSSGKVLLGPLNQAIPLSLLP